MSNKTPKTLLQRFNALFDWPLTPEGSTFCFWLLVATYTTFLLCALLGPVWLRQAAFALHWTVFSWFIIPHAAEWAMRHFYNNKK